MGDESSVSSHEVAPGHLNYEDLRASDEAQIRHKIHLLKQQKGPDHPDTIKATQHLVGCMITSHKYAEALPLAQHEMDYYQRMYGEPEFWSAAQEEEAEVHGRVAGSMLNVVTCLQGMERWQDAEVVCIKALDLTQRVLGPEDTNTICACARLATLWSHMGKHAEAEGMFRRTLDLIGTEGQESELAIYSITNLGICLMRAGKTEEAEGPLRKALELNIREHGLQYIHTHHNMYNLAVGLQRLGKHAEAERFAHRALQGYISVLGSDHPSTGHATTVVQQLRQELAWQALLVQGGHMRVG